MGDGVGRYLTAAEICPLAGKGRGSKGVGLGFWLEIVEKKSGAGV